MDPFRDRVAVVTGGGSGIGAALARAFAARGSRVVLADLDEKAMAGVASELTDAGASVLAVRTDVSKRAEVEALADTTVRQFGAVHVVCNNAGIATFGEIARAPHEDWEFTMGVNFWGVVHGVEAFAPRIVSQGQGGHIVNTASMAGLVGMRWLGIYCASKFAVVGLSEALHRELEPHGVGVSVLCPMIVATNINENSVRMRPAHLQPREPLPALPPTGSMQGGTVTAESVAARVVRAIDDKRFYVLTHPEQREILRRRAARLERAFGDFE
jgi:NAD(P)-dependent dehydrogenase (short-subunit alcohol dehydrogenase family)